MCVDIVVILLIQSVSPRYTAPPNSVFLSFLAALTYISSNDIAARFFTFKQHTLLFLTTSRVVC